MAVKPLFENYFDDAKGFVYLGRFEGYDHHFGSGRDSWRKLDLYAIEHDGHVSIGARYGNEGHEYMSGSIEATGEVYSSKKGAMAECVKRYLAYLLKNHFKHKENT